MGTGVCKKDREPEPRLGGCGPPKLTSRKPRTGSAKSPKRLPTYFEPLPLEDEPPVPTPAAPLEAPPVALPVSAPPLSPLVVPAVPGAAAPVPLFTPLLVPAVPTEPVGPADPAAPLTPPGEMLLVALEVPVPDAPALVPGGQSLMPRLLLVLGDVVPATVPAVLGRHGAPVTPRLPELVPVPVMLGLVPRLVPLELVPSPVLDACASANSGAAARAMATANLLFMSKFPLQGLINIELPNRSSAIQCNSMPQCLCRNPKSGQGTRVCQLPRCGELRRSFMAARIMRSTTCKSAPQRQPRSKPCRKICTSLHSTVRKRLQSRQVQKSRPQARRADSRAE